MKIFLCRKDTGLACDILLDETKMTTGIIDDVPLDAWHLGQKAYRSLLRVALAKGTQLDVMPTDPKLTWWSAYTKTPRVDLILGNKRAFGHAKKLIDQTQKLVQEEDYYTTTFQDQNELLDLIEPAFADRREIESHNIVEAIPIDGDGSCKCKVTSYDNYSSSTGRMSVKDGPKILTLNKTHRSVFRSRWGEEGSLLEIDFTSLEPRVIMFLTGHDISENDLYSYIMTKAHVMYDRDTIKLMILSILYGMKRKNFIVKFMNVSDPDDAYDKLTDVIGTKKILDSLKRDAAGEKFRNYFGRDLSCDESLIVNHYTQSTAVDVACGGFLNFLRNNRDIATPVFLIHDALVIDVKTAHRQEIEKVCKEGLYIPRFGVTFPVKVKVFNGREDH